jgi:hypothetical protein
MKDPYGTTVFCDDIRDEINGKKAYIGVYPNEMIVKEGFPILLPTFGFAVTYLEPLDFPVELVQIKVFAPGEKGEDEIIVDADITADRPERPSGADSDPLAQFRAHFMSFRISPLLIFSAGHLRVRAFLRDKEIKLGSLKIRQANDDEKSKLNW